MLLLAKISSDFPKRVLSGWESCPAPKGKGPTTNATVIFGLLTTIVLLINCEPLCIELSYSLIVAEHIANLSNLFGTQILVKNEHFIHQAVNLVAVGPQPTAAQRRFSASRIKPGF